MSITLDAITLPEDLIWTNEFDYSKVQHSKTLTLSGALIIQSGIAQAGRPIVLTGTISSAWIARLVLKALYTLQESNAQMLLTLHDGTTFNVVFDYEQQGITAKPIIDFNTPHDADDYQLILKFIQV